MSANGISMEEKKTTDTATRTIHVEAPYFEDLKVGQLYTDAPAVTLTAESLTVGLRDGRSVSVPLDWFPRLAHGTAAERDRWELIGHGEGIHWPDLDEDIEVEGLLQGFRSGESQRSFQRWLERRKQR